MHTPFCVLHFALEGDMSNWSLPSKTSTIAEGEKSHDLSSAGSIYRYFLDGLLKDSRLIHFTLGVMILVDAVNDAGDCSCVFFVGGLYGDHPIYYTCFSEIPNPRICNSVWVACCSTHPVRVVSVVGAIGGNREAYHPLTTKKGGFDTGLGLSFLTRADASADHHKNNNPNPHVRVLFVRRHLPRRLQGIGRFVLQP